MNTSTLHPPPFRNRRWEEKIRGDPPPYSLGGLLWKRRPSGKQRRGGHGWPGRSRDSSRRSTRRIFRKKNQKKKKKITGPRSVLPSFHFPGRRHTSGHEQFERPPRTLPRPRANGTTIATNVLPGRSARQRVTWPEALRRKNVPFGLRRNAISGCVFPAAWGRTAPSHVSQRFHFRAEEE